MSWVRLSVWEQELAQARPGEASLGSNRTRGVYCTGGLAWPEWVC